MTAEQMELTLAENSVGKKDVKMVGQTVDQKVYQMVDLKVALTVA